MISVFQNVEGFDGVLPLLEELRVVSKTEIETMRRDEAIYEVWPRYVAAKGGDYGVQTTGVEQPKRSNSLLGRRTSPLAHG